MGDSEEFRYCFYDKNDVRRSVPVKDSTVNMDNGVTTVFCGLTGEEYTVSDRLYSKGNMAALSFINGDYDELGSTPR